MYIDMTTTQQHNGNEMRLFVWAGKRVKRIVLWQTYSPEVFVCWLEAQVDSKSDSCLSSFLRRDILVCICPDLDPTTVVDQALDNLHG